MYYHGINLWAVLVCGVTSFIIGGLWYSPVMFVKPWMKALGRSKDDFKNSSPALPMLLSFISGLVMAFVMAHILNLAFGKCPNPQPDLTEAIETAIGCWGAFTLLPIFVTRNFEQSSNTIFYINVAYRLVDFVVMAVILTLWR